MKAIIQCNERDYNMKAIIQCNERDYNMKAVIQCIQYYVFTCPLLKSQ
jgi:hypothetical protein